MLNSYHSIMMVNCVERISIILPIIFLLSKANAFRVERQCDIQKFEIQAGWTTDVATGNSTTYSGIQCLLYALIPGNSMFPLVTYNKTSSACKTINETHHNIFLRSTGDDNDGVMWNEASCTASVRVFKIYNDTNYDGNDYPSWTQHPTVEDCISHCGVNYPEFKGIVYKYDMTSDSPGFCCCKSVTKQQHIDMGSPIVDLPGSNYYERLC